MHFLSLKIEIFSLLFPVGRLTEAPDLKQEERLQELESCSGVGSTSDDTEVREVSSRPSTPGLSVVSGTKLTCLLLHIISLNIRPSQPSTLASFVSETVTSFKSP